MPHPRPLVTIVTPVCNEESNLPEYIRVVTEVLLRREEYTFQVVFVDDGSCDGSWRLISEVCARDRRFRGLRLSRNFGAHIALSAGIQYATGEAVATLACDLQDPPEVILQFLNEWRRGARLVWGRRRKRGDSAWRVLAGNCFHSLTRRFALPRIAVRHRQLSAHRSASR